MANLTGDGNDNVINGTADADVISGLDGNDTLFGDAGDDLLLGGNGADSLNGGAGDDELNGGSGDDFLVSSEGRDQIDGGFDFDTVTFDGRIDVMDFLITNGTWNAREDGVIVASVTDVESVFGSQFADTFTVAADFVSNGDSFINIRGLGGNDRITALGALGDVTVRADYRGASAGVVVNLADGTARSALPNDAANIGVDTLVQVTQIRGSDFGDQLIGSTAPVFESFRPESGNDFVDGGAGGGSNRIDYRNTPAGVIVDMGLGLTTDDGFGFFDVFLNISEVRGSAHDDQLFGDDSEFNFFQPRAGNDFIDGRGGFDAVDYLFETSNGITVSLGSTSTITGDAAVGTDTLVSVESVRGTVAADTFTADTAFQGSFGRFNVFEGLQGDDVINGNGSTRVEYDRGATARIFADLRVGIISGDASIGTDTVSGIFEVRATAFDDILIGSPNAPGGQTDFESFEGLAGDDLIVGGGGFDRVNYSASPTGVTVNLLTGIAEDGFGGVDTLFDIQGVKGTDFDDVLTGGAGDDVFEPQLGADVIDGGEGVDTVIFDDISSPVNVDLRVDKATHENGDTVVILNVENIEGGGGDDQVIGTSDDNEIFGDGGDDRLIGLTGNDRIVGDDGDDSLFGNSGDDTLIGGDGDDRIFGSFGVDSMDGGFGEDIYFVDNVNDLVIDVGNGGVDIETVFSTVSFTLSSAVENLSLDGGGDIDATGNGSANGLTGNNGNNTLIGGGGNDRLEGGGGDDIMLGGGDDDRLVDGSGADQMNGGAGADTFVLTIDGEAGNVIDDYTPGTDFLDFVDFGFVAPGDALAQFSDVGGEAVFDLAGNGVQTYRLAGVTTAQIDINDFII